MNNKAIGEEVRDDHFHLTMHLVIPAPESDSCPTFTANTSRHCNNHLVSTGPLLAVAMLDAPYPLPELDFHAYLLACLDSAHIVLKTMPQLVVYGTGGRRIPARVLPHPVPNVEPLW